MLTAEEDESAYQVHYKSYVAPLILLCIPPLVLFELVPSVIDNTIQTGELVGMLIGILLPSLGAYYFLEFANFTFSRADDLFHWHWRNLFRNKSGKVPLNRIVKVRRDGMESSNSDGLQFLYRLVVILDDDTIIPLTRGYSGLHDRKLDQIVDQIQDYIGHSSAMH